MASFKEKLDKNGNRIYEVQVSNGRGRRVWRTFRPEPTWSKRTIQRELQKFAAELEQQLADGEVLTREETAQKAAAEAVEAAKIKTFRQYAEAVYLPEKATTLAEKTIKKQDKARADYYNFFTHKKWGDAGSAMLSIDTSTLPSDQVAEAIASYALMMQENLK